MAALFADAASVLRTALDTTVQLDMVSGGAPPVHQPEPNARSLTTKTRDALAPRARCGARRGARGASSAPG